MPTRPRSRLQYAQGYWHEHIRQHQQRGLSRAKMCRWAMQAAEACQPLLNLLACSSISIIPPGPVTWPTGFYAILPGPCRPMAIQENRKAGAADSALKYIRKLYGIEEKIRKGQYIPEQIEEIRQKEARPVLDAFKL